MGGGKTFDLEQMRYDRLVMMSVPADGQCCCMMRRAFGFVGDWSVC